MINQKVTNKNMVINIIITKEPNEMQKTNMHLLEKPIKITVFKQMFLFILNNKEVKNEFL